MTLIQTWFRGKRNPSLQISTSLQNMAASGRERIHEEDINIPLGKAGLETGPRDNVTSNALTLCVYSGVQFVLELRRKPGIWEQRRNWSQVSGDLEKSGLYLEGSEWSRSSVAEVAPSKCLHVLSEFQARQGPASPQARSCWTGFEQNRKIAWLCRVCPNSTPLSFLSKECPPTHATTCLHSLTDLFSPPLQCPHCFPQSSTDQACVQGQWPAWGIRPSFLLSIH